MALFDEKSRYPGNSEIVEVTDRRGRQVPALTVPDTPRQSQLGEHLRREGQRLDHLASFYLQDPNGYWRIVELADAMLPDALAETDRVRIPTVL